MTERNLITRMFAHPSPNFCKPQKVRDLASTPHHFERLVSKLSVRGKETLKMSGKI